MRLRFFLVSSSRHLFFGHSLQKVKELSDILDEVCIGCAQIVQKASDSLPVQLMAIGMADQMTKPQIFIQFATCLLGDHSRSKLWNLQGHVSQQLRVPATASGQALTQFERYASEEVFGAVVESMQIKAVEQNSPCETARGRAYERTTGLLLR